MKRVLALFALFIFAIPLIAQYGAKNGEWRYYGGDLGSTRYAPLDQINKDNVKDLRVAWTWRSDNFGGMEFKSETTPLMVNGVLYFTAGNRRSVVAADAGTGETLWTWRIDEGRRWQQAPRRNSGRGVSYWTDGQQERIFVATPGFQLVALNAKTGLPVPNFGINGVVDLFEQLDLDYTGDLVGKIGNTSPPLVSQDVVVVGPALQVGFRTNKENVKADIMGFDVRTGKKIWTFHTIPRKGEPGYDTWLDGSAEITGNAGAWAPLSLDEELGYLYLPVESPTHDLYGGHRPGNNLYGNSLVCLDIKTGKVVWYFQLSHHDIWDYDPPTAPMLIDLTVNGTPVKAVIQMTKQSFAFVFDRVTGKPVWPIEERPVPQSDVPGERTSPTQPFPTKPPAFDMQGLSVNDLIDFTPELRAQALEAVKPFRLGPLFTPPSLGTAPDGTRGLLMTPQNNGGANWEGGAVDPETGYVYVGSQTGPAVIALTKNPQFTADYISGGGGQLPRVQNLPIVKPPYSRITAFDMNKGEIAWQMAAGDTPPEIKNHPALQGLNLPRTGSLSRPGLLVTKTLLFAGEGYTGQPMFRAHDKQTGEILWEVKLPGAQTGLPMTYMHQGRQFILFTVGDAPSQTPAQIVAFALPPRTPPAGAGQQQQQQQQQQ